MGLTRVAVARPVFILMVILGLVIMGAISFTRLGVELYPSINAPTVSVVTAYPGASPEDVEQQVTKVVEDAVSGINFVDNVNSVSSEGRSVVTVIFKESANADAAATDVERRIATIRAALPKDGNQPVVSKFDFTAQPVLYLTLAGSLPPSELNRLADDVIKPRLEALEGVGQVAIAGGQVREIQIKADPARMSAKGVTFTQVAQAVSRENQGVPGGTVDTGREQVNLRLSGQFQSLDEIQGLVLASVGGRTVKLGEVADVVDTFKKTTTMTRVNGETAVTVAVTKASGANEVKTVDLVRAEMKTLTGSLPPGLKFEATWDNSVMTRSSLNGVQRSLLEAIVLTGLVLLVFLHTFRSTAIVLFAIPTSLISTFLAMSIFGFTLNLMSTLALVLVIGVLVDDSIVVIENIYRHLNRGETPYSAALKGRGEIGLAAIAITLVDIVIFTPIGFLSGISGGFFRQFGLVVVFAVAFSLFISFTLTPMLASRWLKAETPRTMKGVQGRFARWWERAFGRLEHTYERILGRMLQHRWIPPIVAVLSLVFAIALVPLGLVKFEFVPQGDYGIFSVAIETPPGSSLAATDDVAIEVERRLAKIPEIETVLTQVGSSLQGGASSLGVRSAQMTVVLRDRQQRRRTVWQVVAQIKQDTADIPATIRPATSGYGGAQPIQIRVTGDDRATLRRLSQEVEEAVRGTPGVGFVTSSATAGNPEITYNINRARLADYGLTADQVATTLRTAVEGSEVTRLRPATEDEVPIRLIAADAIRSNPAALGELQLSGLKDGQPTAVRLKQVATPREVSGPTTLDRRNRQNTVTIGAGLAGNIALNDVTAPITKKLADWKASGALPAGYKADFGGQAEEQQSAFTNLLFAMALAVLLEYMVLAALYESFIYPLITMVALPVSLVGAFVGLAISANTLNVLSMIGMIVLMGLVGKNGILLVDYTNTLRREGLTRRESLLQAGPTRLRPILMTTAALVFGLMPIALKLEEGSELYAGIGALVIGGMLSSTFLSLFVVPTMYTYFDDLQGLVLRVFRWRPGRVRSPDRRARPDRAAEPRLRPVPADTPAGMD